MKQNIPDTPRRLYDDCVLLKKDRQPDWTARRSNKMRERYASEDHQVTAEMTLIAPVQPSISRAPIAATF